MYFWALLCVFILSKDSIKEVTDYLAELTLNDPRVSPETGWTLEDLQKGICEILVHSQEDTNPTATPLPQNESNHQCDTTERQSHGEVE